MLPGERLRRMVPWRLSCGGRRADGAPFHQEWWTITKLFKGDRYEPHAELQALLEGLKDSGPKPKNVPCLFPAETSGEGVYTALAMFTRRMRVCWCEEFWAKSSVKCEEQGLVWPPAGEPERDYFEGRYTRRFLVPDGDNVRVESVQHGTCDPFICPLAAGEYGALQEVLGQVPDKMIDKRCCGPQVETVVFLPWAKGHSPWARFCSGAWSTGRELPRSLDEIQAAAGGAPLNVIPLALSVTMTPMNTPRGRFALPLVRFVPYQLEWGKLAEGVAERMEQLLQNSLKAEALHDRLLVARALREEAVESTEAQAEFAAEFHPEASEPLLALRERNEDAEEAPTLPLEVE